MNEKNDANKKYLESLPKDKLVEKALEFWMHRNKIIRYADLLEERMKDLDPEFSKMVDKYFWELI